MARRTGLRTIRDLAFKLCRLITAFTPIISKVYPESGALLLALAAANAACEALVMEADNTLEVGD